MGELALAAEKEQTQLRRSARRLTIQDEIADETNAANADYKIKMDAFNKEIAALDKHGKDYENRLKALQNRQTELTQAHENQITQIQDKAEEARNGRILSAMQHFNYEIARGMTSVLMRHESFGKMIVGIGDQIASGMMQNAIKSILMDDMTKERDAAKAARKMYLAGMEFPFPVNVVMAPTMAAAAFASVMAFEVGGIVPGVGRGDIVPAMLTPGEAVLPKDLTEGLTNAAKFGNLGGQSGDIHVHVHHNPTIHALDAQGMERVLQKNAHVLTRHFHNELRKLNR
jgi:hypothetical protein